MSNRKILWKEMFIVFCLMIVVFIISVTHVNESNGIKVYGDEIGYWRNAALITGRDWSGEASTNAYYGYGYGFLLTPILIIFNKDPSSMMHAAIIMQGIMLTSCVAAAWMILKKFFKDIGYICRAMAVVFSVLYPANILFTKITMCEILMTTCVWWLSYLTLCYLQEKKSKQEMLMMGISVYMFSVNQRMLPIVLIVMLFIFVTTLNNQEKKKSLRVIDCILKIMLFLIFVALYKAYDIYYTDSLYEMASDGGNDINRVSTNLSARLAGIKTWKAVVLLSISFCGKIFYAFVASYGVLFIGMAAVLYNFVKGYKEGNKVDSNMWYLYVLFNFGSAIITAALSSGGFEVRNDVLLYGRYSEFSYGPLLLVGVASLYQLEKRGKQKIIIVGIMLVLMLCIVCFHNTYTNASNANFWVNCVAITDLMCNLKTDELTNQNVILASALRCIYVMALFFFSGYLGKKYRIRLVNFILILITIFWIYTADIDWRKNVLPWYTDFQATQNDIIQNMEDENTVIALDARLAGCFQFQMPNVTLKVCSDIEEIAKQKEKTYVITDATSKYASYIREHYVIDKENGSYLRWIYE